MTTTAIPTLEQVVARQVARLTDHTAAAAAAGHTMTVDGTTVTCTCGETILTAPGAQTLIVRVHAGEAVGAITIPTL